MRAWVEFWPCSTARKAFFKSILEVAEGLPLRPVDSSRGHELYADAETNLAWPFWRLEVARQGSILDGFETPRGPDPMLQADFLAALDQQDEIEWTNFCDIATADVYLEQTDLRLSLEIAKEIWPTMRFDRDVHHALLALKGNWTSLHLDELCTYTAVHLWGHKLWLLFPPSVENLGKFMAFELWERSTRDDGGRDFEDPEHDRRLLDLMRSLEGGEYLVSKAGDVVMVPPFSIHAVLTFANSVLIGSTLWQEDTTEQLAALGAWANAMAGIRQQVQREPVPPLPLPAVHTSPRGAAGSPRVSEQCRAASRGGHRFRAKRRQVAHAGSSRSGRARAPYAEAVRVCSLVHYPWPVGSSSSFSASPSRSTKTSSAANTLFAFCSTPRASSDLQRQPQELQRARQAPAAAREGPNYRLDRFSDRDVRGPTPTRRDLGTCQCGMCTARGPVPVNLKFITLVTVTRRVTVAPVINFKLTARALSGPADRWGSRQRPTKAPLHGFHHLQ
jgi:hypothetical protein